mgnify:FL=1
MNLVPSIDQQPAPSLRRWILAQLMRIANRNGHPMWYAMKTRLLGFYAAPDGFDTQRYEAPCWSCGGSGVDEIGECQDCSDGVHHVTRTLLHRFVIEGLVFHQIGRVRIYHDDELEAFEDVPKWRKRITTTKGPKGTSQAASMEAEAWILLLCGGYRALWKWLNGAGLCYAFAGYPLGTLRWLIVRTRQLRFLPQRLRNAWIRWQTRDVPF